MLDRPLSFWERRPRLFKNPSRLTYTCNRVRFLEEPILGECCLPVSITSIPAPYKAGFAKIKGLSSADFDSLVKALEKATPTGGLKGLTSAVVQHVLTLKREDIEDILRTLFSLSVLLTDEETPLPENISRLSSAMQATGTPELSLTEQQKVEFENKLERLLGIRTVALTSKVRRLELEYPKTFHEAVILTDMRPVFEKPEERPVGCAISHTLRITYHEDGEHKEFHVVFDSEDLEKLKKTLQRAEVKASSLKSLLKAANLPDLT